MSTNALSFTERYLASAVETLLSNGSSYAFVSRVTPWPGGTPSEFNGSDMDELSARREMIYGKRISATDVCPTAKRVNWVSNTVYDPYRQSNAPKSANTFVLTDERKVFKCLHNNNGAASTEKPTTASNASFTTSDGYVWKFMYQASTLQMDKFADSGRVPVLLDANVSTAAIAGTIDAVEVVSSGNNWTASDSGVVLSKVSNNTLQVSEYARTVNGYYDGSGFYVTSGPGGGFLSKIDTYVTNSVGNFVNLVTPANSVAFGSNYAISPYVRIVGDGAGAVAYSSVNAVTATVSNVTVVNVGSGYTWANVTLGATAASSNSAYEVVALVSPPMGHGHDARMETCADAVVVNVKVTNADSIPVGVSFRTAGIINSPTSNGSQFSASEFTQFVTANVTLTLGTTTVPTVGEVVIGSSSSASAVVAAANSTQLKMVDVRGAFTVGESALGTSSQASFSVDAINTPGIDAGGGSVVIGSNFEAVGVTASSIEKIKFVIQV